MTSFKYNDIVKQFEYNKPTDYNVNKVLQYISSVININEIEKQRLVGNLKYLYYRFRTLFAKSSRNMLRFENKNRPWLALELKVSIVNLSDSSRGRPKKPFAEHSIRNKRRFVANEQKSSVDIEQELYRVRLLAYREKNISGFAVLVMCVECVPIKLCDSAVAVTEYLAP